MASLASINIRFSADLSQFQTQMQSVQKQLDKTGKKLQNVGANLSAAVTLPLLAFATNSVIAFDDSAKAIAQVEAGLKSTGNQVGFTSEQLQNLAAESQKITLFDDDDILANVTAQLLTFTNIANEQFSRTQTAALDLATRLDGDLKSASIQLGKALNDPVANLSALSRSGIQFSNDQKATINALASTNRLAEAQTIILDELEKQFGGSAEAAAKAGLGPLKQLGNIIGDINEEFGKIIVDAITPFIDKLKGMAERFQELSPETKKWIVILGGVAAAIGPLLALAGTILPAILTGFTLLTGPIGLIIAGLTAIGVVIYKNWAPIKKTLIDIANYFVDLYNESFAFKLGVELIVGAFKTLFEVGKFVFEALKSLLGGLVDNFTNGFNVIGKVIKAVLTGNLSDIPNILKESFDTTIDNFKNMTSNLGDDWKNLMKGIETVSNKTLENVTSKKKLKYFESNVDASGITDAVSKATEKGIKEGTKKAGFGSGGRKPEPTVKEGLKATGVTQLTSPFNGIVAEVPNQINFLTEQQALWLGQLKSLEEQSADILEGVAENFVVGFANVVAGLATGQVGIGAVGGLLLSTLGDLATQIGKAAIQIGITMKAVKLSFKSPLGAIAAGVGLLVVGALLKSLSSSFGDAGAFADGGIVGGTSFYGDRILARVNSGELILNEKQQKRVFNAMNSEPSMGMALSGEFRIKGDDLVLATERTTRKISRRG